MPVKTQISALTFAAAVHNALSILNKLVGKEETPSQDVYVRCAEEASADLGIDRLFVGPIALAVAGARHESVDWMFDSTAGEAWYYSKLLTPSEHT